jgi:hypothetical protein
MPAQATTAEVGEKALSGCTSAMSDIRARNPMVAFGERALVDAHLGHYNATSTTAEAATGRGTTQAASVVLAFVSTDDRTGAISTVTNGWVTDGSFDGGNFGKMFVLRRNTSGAGDVVTRIEFGYGSSTRVGELIATNIVFAGTS